MTDPCKHCLTATIVGYSGNPLRPRDFQMTVFFNNLKNTVYYLKNNRELTERGNYDYEEL